MKNTPLLLIIPLTMLAGLLYLTYCLLSFKKPIHFNKWLLNKDNITEAFLMALCIASLFVNLVLFAIFVVVLMYFKSVRS
jgi:hypothetical protein